MCAEVVRICVNQRHRGAHDLADRDAPAIALQFVAALRPAHSPWSNVSRWRGGNDPDRLIVQFSHDRRSS